MIKSAMLGLAAYALIGDSQIPYSDPLIRRKPKDPPKQNVKKKKQRKAQRIARRKNRK